MLSTELFILFGLLALCSFSTEAYSSTSRCFSRRNWEKLGVHKSTQKTTPNQTFALCLWTASSPHTQLQQPAKLGDAPDGVYETVWCVKNQSDAARNDSQAVFMISKSRPRSTNNSQNRKNISFHVRDSRSLLFIIGRWLNHL